VACRVPTRDQRELGALASILGMIELAHGVEQTLPAARPIRVPAGRATRQIEKVGVDDYLFGTKLELRLIPKSVRALAPVAARRSPGAWG
jgi:hypothetical protein